MPAEFATTAVEIADDVTPTLATSAHQVTQNTKLDTLHTDNTTLQALVDGVETALASILAKLIAAPATEAKQDTLIGHVDGVESALASILAKIIAAPSTEAKQDAANTLLTAIAGSVDGLEGFTDGLEALATALNGYVDGVEAAVAATTTALTDGSQRVGGTVLVGSTPVSGDGRKVVTTAGTAVALASTTACKWVTVTAETDNTGLVVVGCSTVVAALATRRGTPLYAGDSISLPADDLANVYIDATVSTDGVTFVYG